MAVTGLCDILKVLSRVRICIAQWYAFWVCSCWFSEL